MKIVTSLLILAFYGHSLTMTQPPTALQTTHDFYHWYLSKGVNVGWKQVVKRPELSVGFQKRLTVFFQKMEKDNEGGYDPLLQAQDYEEKFTLTPISQTPQKATFYLGMFGEKTAVVILIYVNNKWVIDNVKGV